MKSLKEYLEHQAQVRALASKMRFHRLDEDGVEEDPERNAFAEEIVGKYSKKMLEEALGFAMYLFKMADEDCAECHGRGSIKINDTYDPCDCARKNEKKRKESEPFAKTNGSREANLDQRIAKVKEQLAAAEAKQTKAVAPVLEEIRVLDQEMAVYRAGKFEIEERIAEMDRVIADAQHEIAEIRRKLSEAESRLFRMRQSRAATCEDLDKFQAKNAPLAEKDTALGVKRSRVARHHEPKIDRLKRTLRRLTYLRGEPEKVSVDDVSVSFKEP